MSLKPVSDAVATRAARQVWEYVYPEPWPEDWIVRWQDLSHKRADGDCDLNGKLIRLSWTLKYKEEDEVLFTLIHEFTHLRHPKLRHGKGFNRLAVAGYARIIGDAELEMIPWQRSEYAQTYRELKRLNAEKDQMAQKLNDLREREADLRLEVWWARWQVGIVNGVKR